MIPAMLRNVIARYQLKVKMTNNFNHYIIVEDEVIEDNEVMKYC